MKEFKWVFGHIGKYKYIFITALVLVLVLNLLSMINPYVQGLIVDNVIKGGQTDTLMTLSTIRPWT